MKKLFSFVSILSALILISCDDNESPTKKGQLIFISNAGSPNHVTFSTYDYTSKILKDNVFKLSLPDKPVVINAMAFDANNLYAITSDSKLGIGKIELINSSTWSHINSTDLNLVADSACISIMNNKVFVASLGYDGGTYLHVFNNGSLVMEDEIPIRENAKIKGLFTYENKIYISYTSAGNSKILVLDGVNYEELKEIESPNISKDFAVDSDGYVLAFHISGYMKINTSTLNSVSLEVWGAYVFPGSSVPSFGFDRKNNTVYYPNPSRKLKSLANFDLNRLRYTGLPSHGEDNSFVTFDKTNNLAITAYANRVRLFTKNLEEEFEVEQEEFEMENIPWTVIINTNGL